MEPSSFPSIPRDRERGETLSIAGSRNKGDGDDAMNGRDGAKRRKGVFFIREDRRRVGRARAY